MTRRQRRAHLVIWLVIGPLLLLGLGMAIALRPASPIAEGAKANSPLAATDVDEGGR